MKYRKRFYAIILLFLLLVFITIFTSGLYPLTKNSVMCKVVPLSDYEKYYGHPLPQNRQTEKIFEEPQNYLLVDYTIKLKNNTSKTLFVEDYSSVNISPKYPIVYLKNGVDFYSYYEFKPKEESKAFGCFVIYIGDNNRQDVLKEISDSLKISIWYWVINENFFPLLTFSII